MFLHSYFPARYFTNHYFPGAFVVVVPPEETATTGGQFVFAQIAPVTLSADLVIPAPQLRALVLVSPAATTVQLSVRIASPALAMDWTLIAPTSTSGYPRKVSQAQDETEQLLEHYMLTVAMTRKGK